MTGQDPLRSGDVLILSGEDYRYGSGPVVARVDAVLEQVDYRGEPWWFVRAEAADGTPGNHGGWQRRDLYVREATLGTTRRARNRSGPDTRISRR